MDVKTIFCLFRDFDDARQAVQHLLDGRYHPDRLNTLILEQVAKNSMDIDSGQAFAGLSVPVTGDSVPALDVMLSRKQPVRLTGVGKVYSSGELANILSKTAAALPNRSSENGLEGAFIDFGLAPDVAKKYVSGIRDGGLVLFLRTEDEQAPEVARTFNAMEGTRLIAQVG